MEEIDQSLGQIIHDICRTCMESLSESQHDVFKAPDLKTKLIACTFLPVEAGDGFPAGVCQSCYLKLSEFYEFQQMCVSSMRRCQDLLAKEKGQYTIELAIEQDKRKEPKQEPEEDTIYAEFQELVDLESSILKLEVKTGTPEPEEEELAAEGESPFDVDYENQKDEGDCVSNDVSDEPKEKTPSKPKKNIIVCETCNKRFKTEAMFEAHKLTHKGLKAFPCTQCSKSFTRPNRLRNHTRVVHEPKKGERLPCPEQGCDRTYALQQTLRKHIREGHGGLDKQKHQQAYVCEVCGKVLSSMFTLKNHRYMHTGQELPYACTECGKRHLTKHKLKDHMNRHKGIKNYICPHCGARKTTRTELNTHVNYHTKEKKYPCKFCEQIFNSIGNLGRHIRIVHEGIKKYACKYCGKAFGKAETRNHHEMTHTGEKPHVCRICQKSFIQVISLQKHMKRHYKATEIISEALARAQEPA